MSMATKETLQFLHVQNESTPIDIRNPKDEDERRLLGRTGFKRAWKDLNKLSVFQDERI